MKAEVVHGVVLAVDIKETDPPSVDVHLPRGTRRNLADARDGHETHRVDHTEETRHRSCEGSTQREGGMIDVIRGKIKSLKEKEEGALGYILAWAMGVPVSVLFLVFIIRGCR